MRINADTPICMVNIQARRLCAETIELCSGEPDLTDYRVCIAVRDSATHEARDVHGIEWLTPCV